MGVIHRFHGLAVGAATLVFACAGGPSKNRPPPEYETAPLPDWEPQKSEPSSFDQALLEGEPVREEPTESPSDDTMENSRRDAAGEAGTAQSPTSSDRTRGNRARGAAGAPGWTDP